MLPPQKIIAFDLDGTLAPSKEALLPEIALSLHTLLQERKVVIISGGMFSQFKKQVISVLATIPHSHFENLIILPTSGSQRYEYTREHEWVQTDKINLPQELKDRARKLLEAVIQDPQYEVLPNPIGDIIEDRDTQLTFSARGQLAPQEEKALWDPTIEKRKKIKAFLDPLLPEMNVNIGGISTIDLLQKGFNKAVGLDRLLKKMGYEKGDLLFVGDGIFPGGNDYSVKEAGFETIAISPYSPQETAELLKKWIG